MCYILLASFEYYHVLMFSTEHFVVVVFDAQVATAWPVGVPEILTRNLAFLQQQDVLNHFYLPCSKDRATKSMTHQGSLVACGRE